jgi:hypothetical protein
MFSPLRYRFVEKVQNMEIQLGFRKVNLIIKKASLEIEKVSFTFQKSRLRISKAIPKV